MGTVFEDVACPFSTRSAGGFLHSRHSQELWYGMESMGEKQRLSLGALLSKQRDGAPQATDIDVLSSGGILARTTGPYSK